MFGEWVAEIGDPGAVVYQKLLLAYAVLDPMETHVHGFGPFLFHGLVGKSCSGGIVNLHWGGRLGMLEFLESGAERDGVLAIEIRTGDFCFGSGANNDIKNFADRVDWAIQWWNGNRRLGRVRWLGAQEEMTAGAAASSGLG